MNSRPPICIHVCRADLARRRSFVRLYVRARIRHPKISREAKPRRDLKIAQFSNRSRLPFCLLPAAAREEDFGPACETFNGYATEFGVGRLGRRNVFRCPGIFSSCGLRSARCVAWPPRYSTHLATCSSREVFEVVYDPRERARAIESLAAKKV